MSLSLIRRRLLTTYKGKAIAHDKSGDNDRSYDSDCLVLEIKVLEIFKHSFLPHEADQESADDESNGESKRTDQALIAAKIEGMYSVAMISASHAREEVGSGLRNEYESHQNRKLKEADRQQKQSSHGRAG